jgi:hypothetical protein
MGGDSAYFNDELRIFNDEFKRRFESDVDERTLRHELGSDRLIVHNTFLGERGFMTPHSNQLVASLVYGTGRRDAIQIHRGSLVVATAMLDGGEVAAGSVPAFELTMQTSLLSDFNSYPLQIFTNESEDFFRNRGYGRLSLYFAILHALCLGADVTVHCNNVVTSYLMFLLFRHPDRYSTAVDVETEDPGYLRSLLQREKKYPQMEGFEDFREWHSAEVPHCLPVLRGRCDSPSLALSAPPSLARTRCVPLPQTFRTSFAQIPLPNGPPLCVLPPLRYARRMARR